MTWLEEYSDVNKAIIDYPSDKKIDGLVSQLASRNLQLEGMLAGRHNSLLYSIMETMPLMAYQVAAKVEKRSIERVTAELGQDPLQMDAESLMDAANKLFFSRRDSASDNDMMDCTILLGMLEKAYGIGVDSASLRQRAINTDWGLGYYAGSFKRHMTADYGVYSDPVLDLWGQMQARLRDHTEAFSRHLEADATMKAKWKMEPPRHSGFIQLDFTPLEVEMHDGKLYVLGVDDSRRMILASCSLAGKTEKVDVGLYTIAYGVSNMYLGSLSSGKGLHVVGSRNHEHWTPEIRTFDFGLKPKAGLEGELEKARQLRSQSGVPPLFQAFEEDGTPYFVFWEDRDPNTCLLSEGSLYRFNPTGSEYNTVFKANPRAVASDGSIYLVNNHAVEKLDRWKPTVVLGMESDDCVPSSICVDNGILWAVTQTKCEAGSLISSSIKAHTLKGDFLTHVYPENFPGGYPRVRSMAVRDGMLAYTDFSRKGIDVYRL